MLECCDDEIAKYEQFIWNHRYSIARYLSLRAGKLKTEAAMEVENVAKLKDI